MKPVKTSGFLSRITAGLILFLSSTQAFANGLELYVQPIASIEETERTFKPLADYISEKIGQPVTIRSSSNFFSYWQSMRSKHRFDLVLDAAHFTDYRIKKYDYQVLVKIPDTVSYSLVSRQDLLMFDAQELLGRTVATAASPSLGGVRLAEIFPNPVRQPRAIQADNFQSALNKLRSGEIEAALLPTPLISNDNTVNTVMTTTPTPHMALSASANVSAEIRKLIRQSLLMAIDDPKGKAMLQAINVEKFEMADKSIYDGYSDLLSEVWGYELAPK